MIYYDFYCGWEAAALMLGTLGVLLTLICVIFASPVFSGEYQSNMDSILLTCKYGRGKLAGARMTAIFLNSSLMYLTGIAAYYAVILWAFGFKGWNCPIQFTLPQSPIPLNYLEHQLISIAVGLLGCISVVALTTFLSSLIQ